jgi:small subunit ribosomal protein S20
VANTAQAKKRVRQNEKSRQRNASQRSMMRTSIKKVIAVIESKNVAESTKTLQETVAILDKMATKGLIHKNKAARHKSRLNAKIKALAA